MPGIASLFVDIGADVSGALSGLNSVHTAMNRAATSLTSAGSDLSKALTAPIAVAGGAIVNFGAGFEHAFTGVRKTVDESTTDMAELQKGILDLSTVGAGGSKSAEELASIAEIAGSMGIEGAPGILKFTQVVAGISVATGLTADNVARDMAAFLTAVGLPVDAIDKLGSTVVDLGNRTAATEGQINEFNLRLGGALGTAGVTAQEISGISATLGSLQINAEAGGTAISKFFTDMVSASAGSGGKLVDNTKQVRELQDRITDLNGSLAAATERQKSFGRNTPASTVSATADAVERYKRELAEAQTDLAKVGTTQKKAVGSAEQFANVAGISADAFKDLVKTNPTEAFTRIIEGVARIRDTEGPAAALGALADIGVDDTRMRDALLRLSSGSEQLRANVILANKAWDQNTAAQDEVSKAMQDTTNQFNLMLNQIKRVLIDGWFALKPAVIEVMAALQNVVPLLQRALQWFQSLPPDMQKNVVLWALLAAAIGPALILLGGVVAALSALATPLGLAIVAVGLLAAAWTTNFGDIQGKTKAAADFIGGAFNGIKAKWTEIAPGLVAVVTPFFDANKAIIGRVISLWATFGTLLLTIGERLWREMGALVTNFLLPALQQVGAWLGEHVMGPLLELLKFLGSIAEATGLTDVLGGMSIGDLIRQGELAVQGMSRDIAAGGPGTANSVVVNINNPTVPDQTVAERFAQQVQDQVIAALIGSERAALALPEQGTPGAPF